MVDNRFSMAGIFVIEYCILIIYLIIQTFFFLGKLEMNQ